MKAFECLIESRTESSSSRLYYLVHYAQGEVQKLMRSCLAIDPEDGYPKACKLLKQRWTKDISSLASRNRTREFLVIRFHFFD